MNKNDLIDAVAERTGLAKSDAARAVEAVLGTITEALQRGDTVALSGFGGFVAKARAARTGRNPRTGLQGWQGVEGCSKLARFLARPGA